ncbi:hypothetical protein AAC387_Pa08g0760 [Persea americana]
METTEVSHGRNGNWVTSFHLPFCPGNLQVVLLFQLKLQGGRPFEFEPGVAEPTVALHHVFNTREDKVIWDVGHQAYPHKILTGRRSRMHTIRHTLGLAGFPKRDESVHDAFGAGQSSTSISAALGMYGFSKDGY